MEDTNMFKIIELHPVANFLLGIVLVELTIAAVSDALNSVTQTDVNNWLNSLK